MNYIINEDGTVTRNGQSQNVSSPSSGGPKDNIGWIVIIAAVVGLLFLFFLLSDGLQIFQSGQEKKIQTSETKNYKNIALKGKIADNIGLTMQLSIVGNTVEGTEHYDNQRKNAIIIIKGTIDKYGSMTLSEYDGKKIAGAFKGILKDNKYYGTFTNCNGKSFIFNLSVVDGAALAKAEIYDLQETERNDDNSSAENHQSQKSLNDIRFSHFKSKDWYDNEYIRALRHYFNTYCGGEISDQNLDPYRQIIPGYFVLYKIEPFILGGAYIQFVFFERPELLFTSWVYSDVDEEKEIVLGYEVRGVKVEDEETGLSKDDILQIMSEHPEIKFW